MSERELPKLNEDVYGVILKWVVRKEQSRLLETEMILSKPGKINLKVDWPQALKSNSERLVHHTSVKLLSNTTLCFDWWNIHFRWSNIKRRYYNHQNYKESTKEILKEEWKTMKHFGETFIPHVWHNTPTYQIERFRPHASRPQYSEYHTFPSPVELIYWYWGSHKESCQCIKCVPTDVGLIFKQRCNKDPNIWEMTKDRTPVDRFLPIIVRLAQEAMIQQLKKPQIKW